MSAYRHRQRRTEAEVVELWEGCVKRWELAREAMARVDELASAVIEADRWRVFAAQRQTLADGVRLAETLGSTESRAFNAPRLETMVEAVRREEQRLEARHRSSLKLPYMPQLPDELDEDTADVVYKQLTGVEGSLHWLLAELAAEQKRHEEALAEDISVEELRAAYAAKRDLEAIQKALAYETSKIEERPPNQADRDLRVLLAPVVLLVLLVVVTGTVLMVLQQYPGLVGSAPAPQESHVVDCHSEPDVGKTRP